MVPENAAFQFNPDPMGISGSTSTYTGTYTNELLEFYLNYGKDLGSSTLDVMAGYSWQHFGEETFSRNLDENGLRENANAREYYLLSLFGRVNYTLFDRVVLTATLRQDGSSRFSEQNRYGLFPAAAVAWRVIDTDRARGVLNSLKVRAGYGVTGQQEVGGYYPSQARYLESFTTASYQFGDEFITTLRAEGYNANLKWEETTTYNIGLDFGFFNDRLYGTIEAYQRVTEDLLNFVPVPAGTNLSNFIDANVGDLENRGLEFSLNAIPWQNDRSQWSFGFNVTRNINEITRLTAVDDPDFRGVPTGDAISGAVGNQVQINSVGYPARSFFVYQQVYDEGGSPVENLYVDQNGDGIINDQDLYRFENPAPDYFAGITSNLTVGNFDLSFAGRANFGNYVYNNNQSNLTDFSRLYNPNGFLNNVRSDATVLNFSRPRYLSDFFVQDASFFRMDHITAGYQFNEVWGPDSKRRLRVYATVQNPFVVTNYDGLDPEVFSGIDNNLYPRARTFLFGLNLNL
ncbi:MAG: TonB-dependent receptor [Bacteroidetes bacterium]|nr:MAG: TonB-dependent receptor [Bacteroidota bacterium]